MGRKQRPVLIAGPTASGKSALALALAERDGGVVINADASQVYGCWRILTARPDAGDLARAPHRLYGHVACAADYSVGHWLRDVTAAIADAERAGLRADHRRRHRALLPRADQRPGAHPADPGGGPRRGRRRWTLDRACARRSTRRPSGGSTCSNPMRVQRAWEVLVATGRGLASWQAETEARGDAGGRGGPHRARNRERFT